MSSNAAQLAEFLQSGDPTCLSTSLRDDIANSSGEATRVISDLSDRSSRALEVMHYSLLMMEFCEEVCLRGISLQRQMVEGSMDDAEERLAEYRTIVMMFPVEIALPHIMWHAVLADYHRRKNDWDNVKKQVDELEVLWEECNIPEHSLDSVFGAMMMTASLAVEVGNHEFAERAYAGAGQWSMEGEDEVCIGALMAVSLEMGNLYMRTGQLKKASDAYDLIGRLLSDHSDVLSELLQALARSSLGLFEAGHGSAEKALELTEGNTERLRQYDGADSRYIADSLNARAHALFAAGRNDEGIQAAKDAVEHIKRTSVDEKRIGVCELGLAWLLSHQGRATEALEIAAKLEEYPWAESSCNLIAAIAFYSVERWDFAREHIDQHLACLSRDVEPHSYNYAIAEYYQSLILEKQNSGNDWQDVRERAMSYFSEGDRVYEAMARGEMLPSNANLPQRTPVAVAH